MLPHFIPTLVLTLLVLRCLPCLAQSAPQFDPAQTQPAQAAPFASPQAPSPQPGSIGGTVVDQSGAIVPGAQVSLSGQNPSISQQEITGTDGQFLFVNIAPGPFRLAITSAGFAAKTAAGILRSGEIATVPQIVLTVAENMTEVQVGVSQVEVAAEQIKVQEKQRVLGAIPNFYVSYDPHAVSLDPKQKFQLAWKSTIDPFTFVVVGDPQECSRHKITLRIRTRLRRLRQALRRRLCRHRHQHFHRRRDLSLASEARSALLLQRHGQPNISRSLRYCLCCPLQGRQRALAAQLLGNYGQHGRRRDI